MARLLIIGLIGLLAALAGCNTSQNTPMPTSSVTPQSTALPRGLVTLRYEEGAQAKIISPGGTRILIDVANPSALSRPATEKDVLLTTHTHEDHYKRAFVKAFTGQQLMTRQGDILPGGGDWLLIRPDGVAEMNIREVARTHDQQMIYVSATGLILATPEIFQQWQQGQPVDQSRYSMRSVYAFETSAEQYAWLNRIVAVGVYVRTPTGIEGDVYQIL